MCSVEDASPWDGCCLRQRGQSREERWPNLHAHDQELLYLGAFDVLELRERL